DFAHQNDVGILPQEGAQRGRKVQADLFLHLHLIDAAQLKLDRVFRRHDVGIGLVEARNRGVQRVRLARSGWSRDQHHAVRLQDGFLKLDQRFRLEAEFGHIEPQVFFIEQAEHDLLAPERRQRGNAEVELLSLARDLHFEHDAAVLRQALLADVKLRHDLQARSDRVFQLQGRIHDRLQNAVNAEAHAEFSLVRLHVDVAGPALHGIGQHQVHELDDGSFIRSLFEFLERDLFLFALDLDVARIAALIDRLHYRFQLFFFRSAVGLVDPFNDGTLRSHDRFDVEPGHELDIVHGKNIGGIDHGDSERSAHAAERQDLITPCGFERNQLDDDRINFEVGKIDGGHAILAREEVGDILVGEEAQLHQSRSEADVRLLLK